MFIWIDEDPDVAFQRAGLLFEGAEVTWDMTRILWNGGVDVLNAGVIPLWNTATYYLVEPTVVLSLEVFSLVFMRQHWEGVITEDQFPYNGLDCLATPESAAWCGRYGFYAAQLQAPERAEIFVNESQSFAGRMLAQVPDDHHFTFGLATARRLSEQSGGGFAAPTFKTTALTEALNELINFVITMLPSLLDVAFGVLLDIIQTSFSVLMDALFMFLKAVFYVLKALLKSGMLTTVVTLGVDFAIIMLTEIALPLLIAAIDSLMCLVDYFKPSGWNDQLECVENTCFKGPDAAADVATFFSMNIIIGRFAAIMDATMNSRTGKRFFKAPKTGAVSSKGRTRNPVTGQVLDNKEPESAGMSNPMYDFDFAGAWDDFTPTAASDECSKCFTCKVPELRFIWWLVASIASLISPSNFNTFAGNVTDNCQINGSWYLDACGPWGAERLTFGAWKRGGYTASIAQMDTRIFDAHAASVVDLHERIGSGRDANFAQLVQAAHQWQSVDPSNTEERALAFTYHSCRNMRAEAAENGLAVDMPHRYYELAGGSVGRTATHFLYETCRRAKYEIFTDVGRSIHSFGYQVKACAENKVQCKKDKIQCLSTCGGGDGSQYKHDFATIVSSTELSRFALEGGFYTQAAADCNVRSYVFKVPAFSGGESFATFAARIRTRSGMTAIDTKFCSDNPLSCGAIQNVLEKAPGLVFVNGEFRHKYSLVPPSPPPLPLSPPRIFAYASEPPSPPPPPGTPPPYYGVRKNATRINTPHTLDSPNIWPNTTKCNQSTQPSSGRRAMHTAAAPGGLRPEHYDRIRQRSRDRGARKLCICSEDSGCKTARERLFRPHCLSKSSVRIAHSNHKPVTYIHAHTPLTPT